MTAEGREQDDGMVCAPRSNQDPNDCADHDHEPAVGRKQTCARSGCERDADVRVTIGRGQRVRVRDYCEPCMAEWRTIFATSSPPVTYREEAAHA